MKNYFKLSFVLLLALMVGFTSCDDNDDNDNNDPQEEETASYKLGTTEYTVDEDEKTVTIKDMGEGLGATAVTFHADTTYILDGFVFVNSGQTLTIEEGTMIQGEPGQGANASALVVAKGGTIDAQGTASSPIVFTGKGDTYAGDGFLKKVRGLWGGLIILGNATTNNSVQKRIEGIPETEPRGVYGPDGGDNTNGDDADNSGTLTYISVRHGGTNIGQGNEINGISLGGVGSGTNINHVEVISNMDDGIEFFGGTAQIKHALVAFVGDDSFDTDEGFRGKGQFWCAIQDEVSGDRCAEQDGGTGDDEAAQPYAMPTYYNVTYIGHGGKLMIFRDNAGGTYANSIFANTASGVRIEYRDDKPSCSYDMFTGGNITIKNNIFQDVAGGVVADMLFAKVEDDHGTLPADHETVLAAHFSSNSNASTSVGLVGDEYDDDDNYLLNVVPTSGANSGVAPTDTWFDSVTYQGAFDPNASSHWASWALTFN